MSHTPGPWGFYVEPNGDSPIVGIVDDYDTPHDIFRGESGLDFDTTRANARLAAAAPELLAALIHQCPCECRREIWTDDFGNERDVEDVCRRCAAIAKAEGK